MSFRNHVNFPSPIIEFCYKNDELGDPLIAEEHIAVSNYQTDLTLGLFPLPGPGWTLPAYIWLFAVFLIGLLAGVIVSWMSGLKKRHKVHEANNRALVAEKELQRQTALEPVDENHELNRALAKLP